MAFKSALLNGSSRLDQAATGGSSVKAGGPRDDPEAVRRIQKALAQLVGPMPKSFLKGRGNEPDGTFHGGPAAVPNVPGNRPKCQCSCNCKGDIVKWDYVGSR